MTGVRYLEEQVKVKTKKGPSAACRLDSYWSSETSFCTRTGTHRENGKCQKCTKFMRNWQTDEMAETALLDGRRNIAYGLILYVGNISICYEIE
jgi:hypothetical protein